MDKAIVEDESIAPGIWVKLLAYSESGMAARGEAEREQSVQEFTRLLEKEAGKELTDEKRGELLEVLRLLMTSETFSFTDESTHYVWNVTQALKLIAEKPREMQWFCPWEQGVTLEHIKERYPDIDEERTKSADLSIPLLFIPFSGNCLLIDGWHRLYKAIAQWIPEVPCFLLTQEEADQVLVVCEWVGGQTS